ncbi:MAG: hypothetical protein GC161_02785 [Planctomycetaceae bacterium]|nr:hypothetical protein [Planctomycetaceae bacterium]
MCSFTAILTAASASAQVCEPGWEGTFGGEPGSPNPLFALGAFYDGNGPALFVGGEMGLLSGTPVSRVARWDGANVEAMGGGTNGSVRAFATYDDGTGPALYVAGSFTQAGGQATSGIARWDGSQWSSLGSGLSGFDGTVRALAVADLGSGPELFATGGFTMAGGSPVGRIARWNGTSWLPLGGGLGMPFSASDQGGLALAAFDDGSGPALYVGGDFTAAQSGHAQYLARWNGSTWSSVGGATNSFVHALEVFDDGSGPALYAGGIFTILGGIPGAPNIGRWNGTQWSSVGGGVSQGVRSLATFDDGTGAVLVAGGDFAQAGGQQVNRIAQWDGVTWAPLGVGVQGTSVRALEVVDLGSGPRLFVAGPFQVAGGLTSRGIASWDGSNWALFGPGLTNTVTALEVFDGGSGPELYAVGSFDAPDGASNTGFARWNGSSWTSEPGAASPFALGVAAMRVFDGGAGPALYAGGSVTSIGGVPANAIARYDGSVWSPLGVGLTACSSNQKVHAMLVHDDGSGSALYVAGRFSAAGAIPANNIARYDGTAWSDVGGGLGDGGACFNGGAFALALHDDGNGPQLYAGGEFTQAGGQPAARIARWDGANWHPVGTAGPSASILALASADLGDGPRLYAGGDFFSSTTGAGMSRLAIWDGSAWSSVGGGVSGSASFLFFDTKVSDLRVWDDGTGLALYVSGHFRFVGDTPALNVARWDGQAWNTLDGGVGGPLQVTQNATTMVVYDDGSGESLFVGGYFWQSPGGDSHLARWRGCASASSYQTVAGCAGNPAQLTPAVAELSVGGTLALELDTSAFATGLGLFFVGADGTDGAGCGQVFPGLGEWLLALSPQPIQFAAVPAVSGVSSFSAPMPNQAQLVGLSLTFQGAHLALFDPGVPVELSNALVGTVAP